MSHQEQKQLQQDGKVQNTSSMKDVALMFRDQYGMILSQIERALFALNLMEESEFQFHGYSPERMVEGQPEFIASKLASTYRNFSNYYEEMVYQFSSDQAGLQKTLSETLPQTAFKTFADEFLDRLCKNDHGSADKEVKDLLRQVLTKLIKEQYDPLDRALVAKIKALVGAIQNAPSIQPNLQRDQTELLRRVQQIQQNEQQIADYMSQNKDKPIPSSAFQPATRDSSLDKKPPNTYVGQKPASPVQTNRISPRSEQVVAQKEVKVVADSPRELAAFRHLRDSQKGQKPPKKAAPESTGICSWFSCCFKS